MTQFVTLVIVSSILGMLVPGGVDSGMKKAVRFLIGIVLLIAIAEPIVTAVPSLSSLPHRLYDLLFPDTSEIEEIEDTSEKWVIEYSITNIENGVCSLIEKRFGFPNGSVRTEAKTGKDADGNLTLEGLTVYVGESYAVFAEEIKRYIADLLACSCEVVT